MLPEEREVRRLRSELKTLTEKVAYAIGVLDIEMRKPSTPERGKNVAKISNYIEMANDHALHFGLGLSFKKMEGIKKKLMAKRVPPPTVDKPLDINQKL